MLKTLSLSTIAMLSVTAATAQGIEYLSYGATYTDLSVDGGSADILSLGGSIDYRVNDAFINASLNYADLSGGGDDISITGVNARGGYFVVPQAVIYAGLNYIDSDETDSFSTYNVGAEYMTNGYVFGINYDDSDEDGYEETTTLYASYRPSDVMEVAIGVSNTDGETLTQLGFDYDNGQYDIDAIIANSDGSTLFGIAGDYDLGNGFRALGSYANLDDEGDIYSIGGGYEVSQDMWIDLEIGRIDIDGGDDADVLSLSLQYELGSQTLLIDRAQTTQVEALGVLGRVAELGGF